jgi:hypothetical protein
VPRHHRGSLFSTQIRMLMAPRFPLLLLAALMDSGGVCWGVEELVPGVPLPVAEGSEAGGNGPQTGPQRDLEAADHLLAKLTTDEDEHFRAQSRLCGALIRLGSHGEAKQRWKTFGPSYQSLLAAELAMAWQTRGEAALAAEAAALAESSLPASDTWKTMRSCALLAELYLVQRKEGVAAAWFRRVLDPLDRQGYETAYLLQKPEADQIEVFLRRPANQHFGPQVRLLCGLAEREAAAGRTQQAHEHLRKAAEVVRDARHPSAPQSMPLIIETMHRLGVDSAVVTTVWEAYLGACRKYPDDAEWKAPSLAEAGRLARLIGMGNWLPAIREEAERSSRAVFFLYAPSCWLACARMALGDGDSVEAARLVKEAVTNGAAYPHPRGRAMGLFAVALFHVEEQLAMSPETMGELMK